MTFDFGLKVGLTIVDMSPVMRRCSGGHFNKSVAQFDRRHDCYCCSPRKQVPAHFLYSACAKTYRQCSNQFAFENLRWVKYPIRRVGGDLRREPQHHVDRFFLEYAK